MDVRISTSNQAQSPRSQRGTARASTSKQDIVGDVATSRAIVDRSLENDRGRCAPCNTGQIRSDANSVAQAQVALQDMVLSPGRHSLGTSPCHGAVAEMHASSSWLVFLVSCAAPIADGSDDAAPMRPLDAAMQKDTSPMDASWTGDPDAADSGDIDGTTDTGSMIDAGLSDASQDATLDAGADSSSLCNSMFMGTLATWDFTGEPGNQASTAAKSVAQGITATAVSRANTITPVAGTNSINGSGWSLSKLDGTRYYTFTITPAAKCALDISSVAIDTKASNTGPADGAIATSDDSFVSATHFGPNSSTTVNLSVSGSTKAVEIRIYGYNASSAQGTLRVQNTLTISGALK
jgi:hypothetical protein